MIKNRQENDLVFVNDFHKSVNFYHMIRNRTENDLCQFEIKNFQEAALQTSRVFVLTWFMVWCDISDITGVQQY